MSLAEWGDPDWLDDVARVDLLLAYVRRKRWEAELQANLTISKLAEAMQPKRDTMSLGALERIGFKVTDSRKH